MSITCRRRVWVAVLLALAGATLATAQEREIEPVTDAMLQNPDSADWLNSPSSSRASIPRHLGGGQWPANPA